MKLNYAGSARLRTLGIYALLVGGAVVFCWPLLWMAFTSVKLDRELFARHIHWLPETPQPQLRSPYVDERSFSELVGKRQGDLIPALEDYFRPLAPQLEPDLDREPLVRALARGAYQRLAESLSDEKWMVPNAQLKATAMAAMTPEFTHELLGEVKRGVVVGQLRARSYDLSEDQLVPAEKAASAWKLEGSAEGFLQQSADERGAELHYDFNNGDRLRLTGDFKTSFPVDRLYHLQLSLRTDESWHNIRVTVEKNGRRLEAVTAVPMADPYWSIITWQEKGPDELTNKLRTWIVLKPDDLNPSQVTGDHDLRVTIEIEKASAWGAWMSKITRNYRKVFDNLPFWRYVSTSVLLVILNLVGTLLSCSMVAYAFARLHWPGRNLSFGLMMATMMIPAQVTMIPFFLIIRYLGWYNTLYPLWVCSFFASAFNVFLLYQFFKGIPQDLEDAAKIDGCGPIRSYWYIMLPLVRPSLATVAVFTFMGVWNDFMGPLIYLSDQRLYPLSLGLYALNVQGSDGSMGMSVMLAGAMLMMLPVIGIFFFAQRYFIQGITMTGLKG